MSKKKLFKGIRSVVYFTSELRKASEWYEELLGISPYRSDSDFVGFHINGCNLCLHRHDKKSAPQSGSQVLYWIVDDLDEAIASLKAKGCMTHRNPIDIPEGGRVAQVKDPFGNILGLTEL